MVGAAFWVSSLSCLRRSRETTGTVVGHKTINIAHGGSSSHPVVEFQTPDGKTVAFTDNASAGDLIQIEGNTVIVAYDPNDPQRARIRKFSALHMVPILVIVVGAVILLAGVPAFAGPIMKLKDGLEKILDHLPGWL